MGAWPRRTPQAGVLMLTTMLVLFGMFQVTQAQGANEDFENTLRISQTLHVVPRLEPVDKQEQVATPAVRDPGPHVPQAHDTIDEKVPQPAIEESSPTPVRPGRESIKKDSTAPAVLLPAGPLPDAKSQAPAQKEQLPRELPGQPAPSTTAPGPLLPQPPPIEPSRAQEPVTSPGFEQTAPPAAAPRPWYEQSIPPVQQQPIETPAPQEASPPAASRPWYQQQVPGSAIPLPEAKQPSFGVPLQREQDAISDRPKDHRPAQIDVLSPRQQELPGVDLNPCTRGTGDYPLPRVTNYDARNGVSRGGTITFSGTNFHAGRIVACIGTLQLETLSSSTNQLVVQAPQELITGPLMISHGTNDSNYVLEENFRIIGDPVIFSIEPDTYRPGDQVTVRGSDLSLYPLTTKFPGSSIPNATVTFLKISTDSTHYGAGSFIKVHNYNRSSDMSKITFTVGEVFSQIITYVIDGQVSDLPSYYGETIPQPEVLSGPLRFNSGGSDRFDFAGPNVTWQRDADEFLLTAIKPSAWGGQHPMFVIVSGDNPRGGTEVWFEGSGLDGARFSVGGEQVTGGASAHGRDGFFVVKPSTPGGTVTATKNNVTVSYPDPLTIIPVPAFLPGTLPPAPFAITIDENTELRGWDLQPAHIPGLTYSFVLHGLEVTSQSTWGVCTVELQVLHHTASTLRFKVVPTGALPEHCMSTQLFGGTPPQYYRMQLTAEYGGEKKEIWSMPFHLAR
jgi:hypothetical protein